MSLSFADAARERSLYPGMVGAVGSIPLGQSFFAIDKISQAEFRNCRDSCIAPSDAVRPGPVLLSSSRSRIPDCSLSLFCVVQGMLPGRVEEQPRRHLRL